MDKYNTTQYKAKVHAYIQAFSFETGCFWPV